MSDLFSCPHCGKNVRVADHLLGRAVKCPGCGGRLIAGAAPPIAELEEVNEDQETDDADESHLRRRSKRRRRAQEAVNVPSILLILLGTLGLALKTYFAISSGAMDPARAENSLYVAYWHANKVFGFAWGPLVILGGVTMRTLRFWPLVIAASVLAMVPLNVCCILGIPIGGWALFTVNQPDVKDAFR